jgi:hypothetical protein
VDATDKLSGIEDLQLLCQKSQHKWLAHISQTNAAVLSLLRPEATFTLHKFVGHKVINEDN